MDERQAGRVVRGIRRLGPILLGGLLACAAATLPRLLTDDATTPPPVAAITLSRAEEPRRQAAPHPIRQSEPPLQEEDTAESSLADRLVGVWRMEKHGVRTLSLYADGTATVDVELNMLGALMYGERLTLELDWTLEGDAMTQTVSGGSPEEAVKRLIRDYGGRREYRVVEVDDEQLVLSEVGDDEDRDVWTRVSAVSMTAGTTKQSPR